jgi:phage tail-like protein
MATTKDQIKSSYPLPVYNYKVEIDGETIGFSEVSGLTMTRDTTTYVESPVAGGPPGPRWMYMPAQEKAANITLKKGFVPSISVKTLFAWLNSTQLNRVDKKDIFVRLCDEEGAAVVSWKVINAFPTKLSAPTFAANSNDVAVETLELMADAVRIEAA